MEVVVLCTHGKVWQRDGGVVIIGKDEASATLLRISNELIVRRELYARNRPILCMRDDVDLLRLLQQLVVPTRRGRAAARTRVGAEGLRTPARAA